MDTGSIDRRIRRMFEAFRRRMRTSFPPRGASGRPRRDRRAGRISPLRLLDRVAGPRRRGGLVAGAALLCGALSVGALMYGTAHYRSCGFRGCPDVALLAAWQPGGASVLFDRHGEPLADLAPFERSVVRLDELPPHLPAAFLAVEDRRFERHRGVDWIRVGGALLANLRAGGVVEGSSTISMQLARNVFPRELPGRERTFGRKLREVRVARLLESRYGKDEILEMYLNHIYFGGGAYGVEAASRLHFAKPASELSLAEAALLAALPKAPAHYDPLRQPDRARERRDLVLARMEREGAVPADELEAARAMPLEVVEGRTLPTPTGGYIVDLVRDLLEDHFGERLYTLQLRVHTTVDRGLQEAAEEELDAQLRALDAAGGAGDADTLQGAFVLLDAATGGVRALVGGRPSMATRYNRAVLGRRQLGSAFKPFVYAAAIGAGIPTSRLLADQPLRLEIPGSRVWTPTNYDGRFEGDLPLREALVRSRNLPAVRLAAEVGIPAVAETARSAGIRAPMEETPALALGTVATSPIEVAAAYTTFATLGRRAEPHLVVRVEDASGEVVWEPEHPAPVPAMDPGVAFIVTDILRDAVDRGTGSGVRAAGYRGLAAGKTGTTNEARDAWFVGYTPELVGVVWIGYDEPRSLGRAATGGGLAAPVWGRILARSDQQVAEAGVWPRPPGVVAWTVDGGSGQLLAEGCEPRGNAGAHAELFLAQYLPDTVCPAREGNALARLWSRVRGGSDRALVPRPAVPIR